MLISKETIDVLKLTSKLFSCIINVEKLTFNLSCTAYSFVELVRYLFTVPGVTSFLSGKLCQDRLEKFFGQIRRTIWK